MKLVMKILSISACAVGMTTLSACSDESSSHIDFEDDFEMVLSRANYYYHSKDSLLVITPPECKASTLGYVVWKEEGEEADTMKAYGNGDVASIRLLHENKWSKYDYDAGKYFPVGVWSEPKAVNQNIMNGKRFKKNDVVESIFRYEGDCFASSLLHQLMKKNRLIPLWPSSI